MPSRRTPPGSLANGQVAADTPRAEQGQHRLGVSAAAIDANGISKPPIPSERMSGTGTKINRASPRATARPDTTTARPAVAMVRTGVLDGAASRNLFAKAEHHEQRVVDREREPDQRDDVRHVRDHRDAVGDEETRRSRWPRSCRRQQRTGRPRQPTGRGQEQRDEGDDHRYQLAPPQVGGEDPIEVTLDAG